MYLSVYLFLQLRQQHLHGSSNGSLLIFLKPCLCCVLFRFPRPLSPNSVLFCLTSVGAGRRRHVFKTYICLSACLSVCLFYLIPRTSSSYEHGDGINRWCVHIQTRTVLHATQLYRIIHNSWARSRMVCVCVCVCESLTSDVVGRPAAMVGRPAIGTNKKRGAMCVGLTYIYLYIYI